MAIAELPPLPCHGRNRRYSDTTPYCFRHLPGLLAAVSGNAMSGRLSCSMRSKNGMVSHEPAHMNSIPRLRFFGQSLLAFALFAATPGPIVAQETRPSTQIGEAKGGQADGLKCLLSWGRKG